MTVTIVDEYERIYRICVQQLDKEGSEVGDERCQLMEDVEAPAADAGTLKPYDDPATPSDGGDGQIKETLPGEQVPPTGERHVATNADGLLGTVTRSF